MVKQSWKAWVLVFVIFATGAAAGAFGMRAHMARQWPAMLRPERQGMEERILDMLGREVGLREDQMAALRPAVARTVERMEAIHQAVRGQVDAIMREMDDAIAPLLDEGQKAKFAEFRQRMEKLRRQGPPPPPPGMGPGMGPGMAPPPPGMPPGPPPGQ